MLENITGSDALWVAGSKLAVDLVSPTIKEAGELGRKLFKGVFSGAYYWSDNRVEKFKALQDDVLKNLNHIDPKRIIDQAPTYIIAPAMVAWSYSVDNETLRDMYAKLLAHAAIEDQQTFLHPCFVEIIKQMHPDEAQFFKYIFAKNKIALLNTKWFVSSKNTPSIEYRDGLQNVAFGPKETEIKISAVGVPGEHILRTLVASESLINPAFIDNLARLALITLNYSETVASSDDYIKLLETKELKEDKQRCEEQGYKFVIRNDLAKLTPLGTQFAQICLAQPT